MEGQGETNQRLYQVLALLEGQGGTGRDTRLRSDCGKKLCSETQLPWGLERGPEREGPTYAVAYAFTSPSSLVDCKIGSLLSTYAYPNFRRRVASGGLKTH